MKISKIFLVPLSVSLLFVFSIPLFAQGKGKGPARGKPGVAAPGRSRDKWEKQYEDKDSHPGKKGRKYGATSPRFNGLAKKIGMSPERAQDWYEHERHLNPDLTFGQFVAANMIARKQGGRYPGLTAEAIFRRMRNGESLGQAVRNLGLRGKNYDRERDRVSGVFGDYEQEDRYRKRKSVGEIVDNYIYRVLW